MSNRELPMMPWFPKDFIAATRHLAFAERALYRELLDYQWELGALPVDNVRLARLVGITPEEFEELWPAIADKFELTDAGYVNNRLESHRKTALTGKERRSAGARLTNAKRHGERSLSDTPSDRLALAGEQKSAIAQRSPPTPTPTPQDKNPPTPTSGGSASQGTKTGTPRANGTNPRAQAARDAEQARWQPLLERARACGFREPRIIDTPDTYETSLRLHERDCQGQLR